MEDKSGAIKPPASKSRTRRTSIGDMESKENSGLKQILDQLSAMREENKKTSEENKKSTELMSQSLKNDIQIMKEEFRGEVNDLKKTLDEVVQQVRTDVKSEIGVLEKRVDKVFGDVLDRMDCSEKSLDELHDKMSNQSVINREMGNDVDHMYRVIEKMGEKIIDQEARGRRNNVVFHGVEEKKDETDEETAKRIFKDICKIEGEVVYQRGHRIGSIKHGKIRPFIILFLNYKDKEWVMSCKNNMPRGVYCVNDLPLEVRTARQQLQPALRDAHARGHKAHISYPARLVVDGIERHRVTPKYTGFDPDVLQHGQGEQRRAPLNMNTDRTPAFGKGRYGSLWRGDNLSEGHKGGQRTAVPSGGRGAVASHSKVVSKNGGADEQQSEGSGVVPERRDTVVSAEQGAAPRGAEGGRRDEQIIQTHDGEAGARDEGETQMEIGGSGPAHEEAQSGGGARARSGTLTQEDVDNSG